MIKTKILLCIFITFAGNILVFAQENRNEFSHADTLRGMLTTLRTCYDVKYYNLELKIDIKKKFIEGFNKIKFLAVSDFNKMQIDLFPEMDIEKIVLDNGKKLHFTRDFSAVFIQTPETLKQNTLREITVYYSGNPITAKRPPWDGGFIWKTDNNGNPWVATSCEGIGASLWWPNKDHQSDEPDSMLINIIVPPGLEDISNGQLRKKTKLKNNLVKYDWFVSNPINNYCVTLNIGKFKHFSDLYSGIGGKLTLDYYVMPENLEKAKKQFQQTKKMLTAFENYFGKYPFYEDGFKLIETPYLGMEHQSAISYGNNYLNGYKGTSRSEIGLKFDYIIIHESAHEWWGNSVTANDAADLWIHESFACYAEALYVEYYYGKNESIKYINASKTGIKNENPITGIFNVNKRGPNIYAKGSLVLNTLRSVINNDSLWFDILKGIQKKFYHKTIDGKDIFEYINKKSGKNYNYFFDQYFKNAAIPELDLLIEKKGNKTILKYKWNTDVKDFKMPVKITTSKNKFEFIYPGTEMKEMEINLNPEDLKAAENLFYMNVKIRKRYIYEKSSINLE